MKSFHCYEPKERQIHLVPLMLFGDTTVKQSYGHGYVRSEIWLHGSLMLQYIFGFEDPYRVTKSLLSLEQKELLGICNDKSGSHVIDSFLQSNTVAPKHKSYMVEKLRGCFADLACDRFGSRILDYLLNTVDPKMKSAMMDELAAKEAMLNANRNGWFVNKKAGVHHYKHRYEEWREEDRGRDKRRREFDEIIDDRRPMKASRFK